MCRISEELVTHLLTVLNSFNQLQESHPTHHKSKIIPNILISKKIDREKEEAAAAHHVMHPHYSRLHGVLKSAHNTYRVNCEVKFK